MTLPDSYIILVDDFSKECDKKIEWSRVNSFTGRTFSKLRGFGKDFDGTLMGKTGDNLDSDIHYIIRLRDPSEPTKPEKVLLVPERAIIFEDGLPEFESGTLKRFTTIPAEWTLRVRRKE